MVQGPIRCEYHSCDEEAEYRDNLTGYQVNVCETHMPIIKNRIMELDGIDDYFIDYIRRNTWEEWEFPIERLQQLIDLIPIKYLLRHYFNVMLSLQRIMSESWEGWDQIEVTCRAVIQNIEGIYASWVDNEMGPWYGETAQDLRVVLEDSV